MGIQSVGSSQAHSPLERRRSSRLKVATPVVVAWYDSEERYVHSQGETEDVSYHGTLLRMKRGVRVGQVVRLLHSASDSGGMLACVVRCGTPDPDGYSHVGLKLAVPGNAF